MKIKRDDDINFIIDKLIEYHDELSEQIKINKEKKREIEKIIKTYLIKDKVEEYKSPYFKVKINKKLTKRVKISNIKRRIEDKDYEVLDIKYSLSTVKSIMNKFEESRETIHTEYLYKYITYTKQEEKNPNDKISLIDYFYQDLEKYLGSITIGNIEYDEELTNNLEPKNFNIKIVRRVN